MNTHIKNAAKNIIILRAECLKCVFHKCHMESRAITRSPRNINLVYQPVSKFCTAHGNNISNEISGDLWLRLFSQGYHTFEQPPGFNKQMVMMTSSNGNFFRVTGPLRGEFTGHRWIPLTKASDAELWIFLWSSNVENVSIWWRHHWVKPGHRLFKIWVISTWQPKYP